MDDGPIRIVISYRRDDSSGHAGHLYADLVGHFGEGQVFIDIDAIEPGLDFAEVITSAIKSADVLVAVVGRRWLSATDRHGRRRVDLEGDFVRLEIEFAINRQLRILPVLVQGAEMPSEEELPASLAAFSRRHALELSDKRWRDDVNRLVELLEGLAEAKAQHRRAVEAARNAAQEHVAPGQEQLVAVIGPVSGGQTEHQVRSPALSPPTRARRWPIRAGVAAAVLVLALIGLVVAVSSRDNEHPAESDDKQATTTTLDRAVQVRGDVTWTDTGIDVAAGQGLEIVATGRIETWRGIPFRDCGPAGLPAEEFGDNVILGVRHGALIGRIGRSELFEVGAQMTGRAPASGRLYLGVNDKGVENNAGSYGVTLTIT